MFCPCGGSRSSMARILVGFYAVFLSWSLCAQSEAPPTPLPKSTTVGKPAAGTSAAGKPTAGASAAIIDSIPRSFRALSLGMELQALKDALASDELFRFRGDRDVSLLPLGEQILIETTGLSYIRRAFFQFKDGKLFNMAFTLDTGLVDHYSVFTDFASKYGEPTDLNPREAVWSSGLTRVSIERPLTVKYLDMMVFGELQNQSRVKESKEAVLRKDFLDGF